MKTPDASKADEFRHRYGPWAVIAGGSEGIGQSFALQLAARGLHLVLLARRAPALEEAAARIRAAHAVEVVTAAVDLTAGQLEQTIPALCADKDVGLVIYNAGSMHGAGLFIDQPLERSLALVQLNCMGPLWFTHHFGRRLRQRGRGGIVLMASMAGLAGTDALRKLCGPGVVLADMTALWESLLKRKKFYDLTGNGVNHPNDFGHLVYAQTLLSLLAEPPK